jgi:hypothetical protein
MKPQVADLSTTTRCSLCNAGHCTAKCPKFLDSSIENKLQLIRKNKLCFNCLHSRHGSKECKSSLCRICKRKHHTSIHHEKQHELAEGSSRQQEAESQTGESSSSYCSMKGQPCANAPILFSNCHRMG